MNSGNKVKKQAVNKWMQEEITNKIDQNGSPAPRRALLKSGAPKALASKRDPRSFLTGCRGSGACRGARVICEYSDCADMRLPPSLSERSSASTSCRGTGAYRRGDAPAGSGRLYDSIRRTMSTSCAGRVGVDACASSAARSLRAMSMSLSLRGPRWTMVRGGNGDALAWRVPEELLAPADELPAPATEVCRSAGGQRHGTSGRGRRASQGTTPGRGCIPPPVPLVRVCSYARTSRAPSAQASSASCARTPECRCPLSCSHRTSPVAFSAGGGGSTR